MDGGEEKPDSGRQTEDLLSKQGGKGRAQVARCNIPVERLEYIGQRDMIYRFVLSDISVYLFQ